LEVARKDERAKIWCKDACRISGQEWYYLKVPENLFRNNPTNNFEELYNLAKK